MASAILSIACCTLFARPTWAESLVQWQAQTSGTSVSLRGISVVDHVTAWASGARGTVIRTVDGGTTWQAVSVPRSEELDFRDLQAFSATEALVLSAGSPAKIYRTADSGLTWIETFGDDRESIFFDAMAFRSPQNGLAFSDPIDGRLVLIQTVNGGVSWNLLPAGRSPRTRAGEAGFAASGTCLAVHGTDRAWIGLGGPSAEPDAMARVFLTTDSGQTWRVTNTTLPTGPTRGIFSLAFFDAQHGVAVGGDFQQPDDTTGVVSVTIDGGQTWHTPTGPHPTGYRSAVAIWPAASGRWCLAVGRNGADLSTDAGRSWQRIAEAPYQAVAISPDGTSGWAVGANGAIAKVSRSKPP